jgi:hypothetical protein
MPISNQAVIDRLDIHVNSPIRHEKAMPANNICNIHPKKSVKASLLQWSGCSSWNSTKGPNVDISVAIDDDNDEFIVINF